MNNFLKKFIENEYLFIFLIFVLCFIAFANNLNVPYYYDDFGQIVSNNKLHDITNFKDIIFCNLRQIRVFQNITLAIDWFFSGPRPVAFHITNNILHFLSCIFLFLFLKKLPNLPIKVIKLTVLIFAIHPIQIFSVTYIMGRISILQNLSIFIILNEAAKFERRSYLKLFIYLVFSTLVKENNILIPFLIILMDLVYAKFILNFTTVKRYGILFSSAIALAIFHRILKDPNNNMYNLVVGFKLYWPVHEYIITQAYFNFYFIYLFFMPHALSIYTDMPPFSNTILVLGIMNILLIISLIYFSIKNKARWPHLFFFLGYFLIIHGSTNSILQMVNPFAEYRLSVSFLPILIAFSYLFFYLFKSKMLLRSMLGLILSLFLFFTISLNSKLKSPLKMYYYALEENQSFYLHVAAAMTSSYLYHNCKNSIDHLVKAMNIGTKVTFQQVSALEFLGQSYFLCKDFDKSLSVNLYLLKLNNELSEQSLHDLYVSIIYLKKENELRKLLDLIKNNKAPSLHERALKTLSKLNNQH